MQRVMDQFCIVMLAHGPANDKGGALLPMHSCMGRSALNKDDFLRTASFYITW